MMNLRIFVEKNGKMKIIIIFILIDLRRKVGVFIVIVTRKKNVYWMYTKNKSSWKNKQEKEQE